MISVPDGGLGRAREVLRGSRQLLCGAEPGAGVTPPGRWLGCRCRVQPMGGSAAQVT
jgi:hypothetical protein